MTTIGRLALGALLVAGCSLGGAVGTTQPGAADPVAAGSVLTVFAAASLRDPIEDAARRFEATHPGLAVRVSFASSTALRTQIEQGARADVFLSADTVNAEALLASGATTGTATVFAHTSVVLVVPLENPARIATPLDLARQGLTIIAAGDGVPVTAYAARVLAALAAQPGYPADYAEAVQGNIATREADVRAVLTKVALGEGDAAFVYATDAAGSSRVRIVALPAEAHVLVSYAGVVLDDALRPPDARVFLAWLDGPDGQALLARYGFEAGS